MGKKENKISSSARDYIEQLKNEAKSKTPEQIINQNINLIIFFKDPDISFYFITEYNELLDETKHFKLEQNIIGKGNLELAVLLSTKMKIECIKKLEERILKSKDAKQIYLFLTHNDSSNKNEIEEKLIQTGSAEFNCKYAQHLIENNPLDIKKYEQIVLNSKEPKWICELGISLLEIGYNDNVEDYIDRIINCKDAQYVYMILKKVSEKAPNIDISKYKTKIIELGVSKLIYRMASLLNNKKNDDLENAIINSNDIVMLYIYAKNIQNIDINIFTRKIIQSGNYELMIKYAKEVLNKRNENINDIQDAIIKTKNTEIITKFASEVNGIDIHKCFKTITKTKNIEVICAFAAQVPELDKTILSLLIELKNDAKWSNTFIKYFPDVDVDTHRKIIEQNQPKVQIQTKQQPKQPRVKITLQKPEPPKTLDEAWETRNIKTILAFAKEQLDCQEELSRRIIEMNNPKWSYYFMQTTGNIDWEEHKEIVLSNPTWKDKYEKLFGKPQDLQKKQVKQKKKR